MSKLEVAVEIGTAAAREAASMGTKLLHEIMPGAKALGTLAEEAGAVANAGRIGVLSDIEQTTRIFPKSGDQLFVPSRGSDMSPEFDRMGGLATIRSWKMDTSGGKQVPFVTFHEFPGSLNYDILVADQAKLSETYAGRAAQHIPSSFDGDGFARF